MAALVSPKQGGLRSESCSGSDLRFSPRALLLVPPLLQTPPPWLLNNQCLITLFTVNLFLKEE